MSPDERVQSEDSWVQWLKEGLEGAARVKRRKKEPDHEAFAQLSLANGLSPPAPVPPPLASGPPSQYQHTLIPPAPLPFPQPQAHPYTNRSAPNPFGAPVTPPLQQGESHLTSSTVTPTSHSDIEPSLSPPFSMGGEESFGLGLGLGLSAPGGLEGTSRSSAQSLEDAEMRPNRGTYDIDPHRVYIASLSDDETSPPPSPPSSSLAFHPSLLANGSAPFPPSPLPPSLVPSPSAGPLILYRPLKFGPEAEREKQEQEEEEKRASRKAELDEFRRQQEMEERMESVEEVLDAQEGVEMMDLDG